jgi:hypothetical protein
VQLSPSNKQAQGGTARLLKAIAKAKNLYSIFYQGIGTGSFSRYWATVLRF